VIARLEYVWSALLAATVVSGAVFWATVSLEPSARTPERTVQDFVVAYNKRDLTSMLALATPDIEWMSVSPKGMSIETRGHDALRNTAESAFRECPSCQASIEQVRRAGSRVTAIEHASWDTASGSMSRRSLSVYEFRDGLISRVYYFPAE
jgi:hypothetical protein